MSAVPRKQRLADLIHRHLADLFLKTVYDPRLKNISLTRVQMSADLKQANIFYTVLKDEERPSVQKALESSTGYIRHQLAQSVSLKYVPKIRFLYDASIARANRITDLINQVSPSSSDHSEDE